MMDSHLLTSCFLGSWSCRRLYSLQKKENVIFDKRLGPYFTSGLYYKHFMIVNDNYSHQNDAQSCGITYDHHSDDSRGVFYAHREHI